MQWLEIIRLLTSRGKIGVLLEDLSAIIRDLQGTDGKESVTVHSRKAFESDLLICIRWKRDGQPEKSREGFLLAEYLTDFGMVDHEIWKQELPPSPVDLEEANAAIGGG